VGEEVMSEGGWQPCQIPELNLDKLQDPQEVQHLLEQQHQKQEHQTSSAPACSAREEELIFSPTSLRAIVGGPDIPKLLVPPQLFASQMSASSTTADADPKGGQMEESGEELLTLSPPAMEGDALLNYSLDVGSPFSRTVEMQFQVLASGLNSTSDTPVGPPAGLYQMEYTDIGDRNTEYQPLAEGPTSSQPILQGRNASPLLGLEPEVDGSNQPLEYQAFSAIGAYHGDAFLLDQTNPSSDRTARSACRGCLGDFGLCICSPVSVSTEQAPEVLNTYEELAHTSECHREPHNSSEIQQESSQDGRDSFDSCRSWEGDIVVSSEELQQEGVRPAEDTYRLLQEAFGQQSLPGDSGFRDSKSRLPRLPSREQDLIRMMLNDNLGRKALRQQPDNGNQCHSCKVGAVSCVRAIEDTLDSQKTSATCAWTDRAEL